MATLENYRQIVCELLAEHATNNDPNIESQVISDTENDHYLKSNDKGHSYDSHKLQPFSRSMNHTVGKGEQPESPYDCGLFT